MTSLLFLVDLKSNNYEAILNVIDYLAKMVHHEYIKTTIDINSLSKVIINIVV